MVEEERRGKAYSKIMNQQSVASLETDCARETLNDIFMNTSGFSAKSVQAITKEMLFKEERSKNYSWRKDMDNFEDNLERTAHHKRNVREATKATRDVGFKDTNSKIKDYDREARRNVDSDPPRTNSIVINTKPIIQTPSYSSTVERKNTDNNSYRSTAGVTSNSDSMADSNTDVKRGSWRRDMEQYEDKLGTTSRQSETTKDTTRTVTSSAVDTEPKTYSWRKASNTSAETKATDKIRDETLVKTASSWKKPDTVKQVEVKTVSPAIQTPASRKTVEEPKLTVPAWKKPESFNKIESKETEQQKPKEPEKPVPKWKKPEVEKIEIDEAKPAEQEVFKQNKPTQENSKTIENEKSIEPEKPVPKWKKPEVEKIKIDEAKPA